MASNKKFGRQHEAMTASVHNAMGRAECQEHIAIRHSIEDLRFSLLWRVSADRNNRLAIRRACICCRACRFLGRHLGRCRKLAACGQTLQGRTPMVETGAAVILGTSGNDWLHLIGGDRRDTERQRQQFRQRVAGRKLAPASRRLRTSRGTTKPRSRDEAWPGPRCPSRL